MKPRLHLVDASPYIFRAFHALPSSIRDPEGAPANAILGFAGFLLRLIDSERPSHLALCFDESLTTSFRNDLYPGYKAQREPPPLELTEQVDDCREIGEALGMATLTEPSFEADDLIASARSASRGWAGGWVVVSSDKDLAQLVDDETILLDFARDQRLGPDDVVEKLGVRPEQVPDLLGLAGDSVDNIPGVKGVGAKTAIRLLGAFDSLEDVLGDLDAVADLPLRGARSLAERLSSQSEIARLSKRLATVSRGAPVPAERSDLAIRPVDMSRVERLCERRGLAGLYERIRRSR